MSKVKNYFPQFSFKCHNFNPDFFIALTSPITSPAQRDSMSFKIHCEYKSRFSLHSSRARKVLLFHAFQRWKHFPTLEHKSRVETKSSFCARAFKGILFDCSSHYAQMLSFKFCEKCSDINTSHCFTMSHFSLISFYSITVVLPFTICIKYS